MLSYEINKLVATCYIFEVVNLMHSL